MIYYLSTTFETIIMETSTVRIFFAIALPDEVKQAIIQLTSVLKKQLMPLHLSWIKDNNLHITLRFLGETPQQKIPQLVDAVKTALQNIKPFNIELTAIRPFPTSRPHLLIRTATLSKELATLFYAIDETCQQQGFSPDRRPFVPHITLARSENQLKITPVQLSKIENNSFAVTAVNLFESKTMPTGSVYTSLAEIVIARP